MRNLFLMSIASLVAVAAICALTAEPAMGQTLKAAPAAKSWTLPKTPWGDPDLQGTWTSDDCIGTPLQRPVNLGDRLYYTEQELADRQSRLNTQLQNDLVETVAPNQRVGTGPPGHWGERARRPCKQTSLIMDPPNGRMPDMLPEAKTRRIPEGAGNNTPKADSWEDSMDRVVTEPKEGAPFTGPHMSLLDTTQQALESAMSGSMLQQTLLTNNLANADTPGYQPEAVNFQSTLANALQSGQSPTSVTYQPYSVAQSTGPDGNGISPEQQEAALSQNGLLYETLTQVAAQRESILESAMGVGQS